MKISLSSLIKILVQAFPTDAISINPVEKGKRQKDHISLEIEYGRNMGGILYDIKNNIAFAPSKNFSQIIEGAIGEVNARQLRESLRKQEEQSNAEVNDWSDEAYQREKGETPKIDAAQARAEHEAMSHTTLSNLM